MKGAGGFAHSPRRVESLLIEPSPIESPRIASMACTAFGDPGRVRPGTLAGVNMTARQITNNTNRDPAIGERLPR